MTRRGAHIPWMDKRKPKPEWLTVPPGEDAKLSYRIAWRYWSKLWTAIPPWAKREDIAPIYRRAHEMREFGRKVHVDHVIPLRGTLVCGLHCKENLAIITEQENYGKSNHTWPDMPYEQTALDFGEVAPHQLTI